MEKGWSKQSLIIVFTDSYSIEVIIKPEVYVGPEVFCATFKDGVIVVE